MNLSQNVDYTKEVGDDLGADLSPMPKKPTKRTANSDSDTDFQAPDEDSEEEMPDGDNDEAGLELDKGDQDKPSRNQTYTFKRAEIPLLTPRGAMLPNGRAGSVESDDGQYHPCIACNESHNTGYCPLKIAGVEYCNLCGLAHYGVARTCPHLNSVTQLRAMVDAIKQSSEPSELKELARKRIVGIIGDLNQRKRKKQEAQLKRDVVVPPLPAAEANDAAGSPASCLSPRLRGGRSRAGLHAGEWACRVGVLCQWREEG